MPPAAAPKRSRALTVLPERRPSALMFSEEERSIIKQTICPDANEPELRAFLYLAASMGLNPIKKQVHLVIYNKQRSDRRMVLITGIDGYRLKAAQSGDYAGLDKPAFIYRAGPSSKSDPLNPLNLEACELTGYKFGPNGQRVPYSVIRYWDETRKTEDVWASGPDGRQKTGKKLSGLWAEMPRAMLAKCTEALLLRTMLPADLAGLYLEDEVHVAAREGELQGYRSAELEAQPDGGDPPPPPPQGIPPEDVDGPPDLSDAQDWNEAFARIPLRAASAKQSTWFWSFLQGHFGVDNEGLCRMYGGKERLPREVINQPMGQTLRDVEIRLQLAAPEAPIDGEYQVSDESPPPPETQAEAER